MSGFYAPLFFLGLADGPVVIVDTPARRVFSVANDVRVFRVASEPRVFIV